MPSVSSSTSNSPTSSGIATDPTGARHIPSSTRPDGSLRKEIKIRPGYKPPEDVEIYKNRTAEAWKTRGNRGGVPGAAGADSDQDGKGTSTKNAKRREARKKKAKEEVHGNGDGGEIEMKSPSKKSGSAQDNWRENAKPTEEPVDPEIEKAKQVRNLKKKLRQAKELREKKDKGDSLLPEQIGKIVKINELVRQLEGLGFKDEDDEEPMEP